MTVRPASDASVEPSSAASESWLVARGLLGKDRFGELVPRRGMVPPCGADVNETRQTDTRTGRLLMQVESWSESEGGDTIHIEVTAFPGDRHAVAFWAFPQQRPGCSMFQWTMYEGDSALQSRYWRSAPAPPPLPGCQPLPIGLYPDAIPWLAFLRVLEAPREGAVGVLNQQITANSYVAHDVSATGVERVTVLAGEFTALKVTAQVDVATILPNWPRVALRIIQPVVPVNTLHFEAIPPYRLLRQEGVTFVGGPEVTSELVRSYTAQSPSVVASAPRLRQLA